MPIRPTRRRSTAEHLADLRRSRRRLQTAERFHARIAEPGSGLMGVVHAEQPVLVAAAAEVTEGQRLAIRQLGAVALDEGAGVPVQRADLNSGAVVVDPPALQLSLRLRRHWG